MEAHTEDAKLIDEPHAPSCRICGNNRGNTVFVVREMLFGTRKPYEYFQCAQCQTLQIAAIPRNMREYYPGEYYTLQPLLERKYSGIQGFFRLLPFRASLKPTLPLMWTINQIRPHEHSGCLHGLPLDEKTRILDVGCGNAKHFLYPLRQIGFDCLGCDPYISDSIHYRNGLTVLKAEITELDGDGGFDLITFHHSLEHVGNPVEVLRCASGLLREGGMIVIRIPTVSSFAWSHYAVNWVQLDAPRHLFLYSVDGLKHVAGLVGLRVVKVRYDSCYFQFWGSENYAADISFKDQKKGSGPRWWWKRWRMNRRAVELNKQEYGDQAAFILLKETDCESASRALL